MATPLPYIQPKNSLARELRKKQIVETVISRVSELNVNFRKKDDMEFILLVCQLLEHLVLKKDKIDKKALALNVFRGLFNDDICDADIEKISQHIDFLWENKQIVKVSFFRKIPAILCEWFERKIA